MASEWRPRLPWPRFEKGELWSPRTARTLARLVQKLHYEIDAWIILMPGRFGMHGAPCLSLSYKKARGIRHTYIQFRDPQLAEEILNDLRRRLSAARVTIYEVESCAAWFAKLKELGMV
jgi:hypothetical protein